MDLKGLAALLWPVFAITALVKLGPELKQLIASFKGGRVAFKVAGQELTIEQAIGTIDSKLRTLQIVTKGIVTHGETELLTGLATSVPFPVDFSWHMFRELERLDAIRYVTPVRPAGTNALTERDGGVKFELKDYVRITDDGREYLNLRAEILAIQASDRGAR